MIREVENLTLQVLNSPFSEEQVKQLNTLLPTLNDYQKIWLTGYLSVVPATAVVPVIDTAEEVKVIATEPQSATILYGSQTGNAQSLAEKLGKELRDAGVEATVLAMSAFKTNQLKKLTNLFIITSTHGEGTPPDNAIQFHEFLYSKRAPKLENIQYSVLALGDSSYEFFCKTGADFDEQLAKLGAQRIVPRVDCDLDYDDLAAGWFENVKNALVTVAPATVSQTSVVTKDPSSTQYLKKNPFYAEVLEKINLNGRGSNKATYHVELSLEESGLTYAPGDSIGILPENDEQLVRLLIEALGFQQEEIVQVDEQAVPLGEVLQRKLEITVLSKPLLQKIQNFTVNSDLAELLQDDQKWKDYVYGRDLLDVVRSFGPFSWNAQQFVELLRKIPARLYSIASSQEANEEEAHLTIGKVSYETDGRDRLGVCSGQIAERIEIGQKLPIYIHANPNFKLPQDDNIPIIMIGAGTGIAPFRSFVEERAARGAEGKSWLFFGDQHFVTDFLYQTDWQGWVKDGALTNLTTAFSRDGEEKVYVQHRLQEHAKELYEWIEQGAVIYVCGDEKTMAADVDKTLHAIIAEQGAKAAEQAAEYINNLKQQQRYQRDVY